MRLTVVEPSAVFLEVTVDKVVAQGVEGSFGLLPRHLDMAAALAPGILAYWPCGGGEHFVAVDGGILIKQADRVQVATRTAVAGELGTLHQTVRRFFADMDERERQSRTVVARLEADFIRRFVEFGKHV